MTDPLAFLTAVLDAAQRDAEAAAKDTEPEWSDGGEYGEDVHAMPHGGYVAVGPWNCPLGDGVRRHIARHDPAAVLRRIAADRKTLAIATRRIDCGHAHPDADIHHPDGHHDEELLRTLAEAWGWQETTT